jgi:FtsZ-binding cell division protein ZapB
MLLLQGVKAGLIEVYEAAKDCTDPVQAQAVVEELEEFIRNDVKELLATWKERRVALLGKRGADLPDGRRVFTVPKWKYEWHHDQIVERAIARARYTLDGERIDDLDELARRTAVLVRDCYVTASTEPRTEGLRAIGYEKKEAAGSRVEVGREVKLTVPKKGRDGSGD